MLHKSNTFHYYNLKYVALIVSIFFIILLLFIGDNRTLLLQDFHALLPLLLGFGLGLWLYKKTNYAAINYKKIELDNGQRVVTKSWSQVASIKFF